MRNSIFKNSQDFRKSLEMRLQKASKEKGIDLQRIRRQVAFDRLLARFFTPLETPFFLKGGYAMELRLSSARATKDIDLTYLQRVKNQGDVLSALILSDLQKLASTDLGDYFSYALGEAQLDLDNAPYGGARYPVSTFIDGKLFVRFHLDVGGDVLTSSTETLTTPDWLNFCGISAPRVKIISIEQQFAEKIHAYTLPRGDKPNSRVKDLIDILLLMKMRTLNLGTLNMNLQKVFKIRNTHALPSQLPTPPLEWTQPYSNLAEECGLEKNLSLAFQEIASFFSSPYL
jgi:predicted nucleotidyltransferase component of viral defense system